MATDGDGNLSRVYELVPQMQLYHRLNVAQVWEPFLMRTAVPNLRRDRVETDGWGMRRSIGPGGRAVTLDVIDRDDPVDLVFGGSFCFGVGATGDAGTLPSALAQRTGRATLNLGGFSHSLAQNLVSFMFLAGRFTDVRNIVIAGLNEIYLLQACDVISRRFGLFQFSGRFLEAMNGGMDDRRRAALVGAKPRPFAPLSHDAGGEEEERALLNDTLESALSTWSRHAGALNARLICMTQPAPVLQQRRLAPQEEELLAHFDAASGIKEDYDRAIACHTAWHRADMESLSERQGFDYLDINDLIGPDHDGSWLYADRVHMTDDGYALVAEILKDRLQP